MDLLLNIDGDLSITENGDVSLTESIRQEVLIRLQWILGEWRLGPDFGFPYFEDVMVKNRDYALIRQLIESECLKVSGVLNAQVTRIDASAETRIATVYFTMETTEGSFENEVTLYG